MGRNSTKPSTAHETQTKQKQHYKNKLIKYLYQTINPKQRLATLVERLLKLTEYSGRRWKFFVILAGLTMIALSILPIPLKGPTSKLSSMALEIPPIDSQSEKPLQPKSKTNLILLALSPRLNEQTQDNTVKPNSRINTPKHTLRTVTVKKGDSLSVIFGRLKLPLSQLYTILDAGDETKQFKHLRPGQTLDFEIGANQVVKKIVYQFDNVNELEITLKEDENGYVAKTISADLERRIVFATGAINQSLFLSGQRAGLSDKVIMQLVGIFAWDVDFALDVRTGDHFSLIYEQFYKKGEKIRDGNILATEFINQKRVFRAVQYENDKGEMGHYTPDGHNMRKMFLRMPVEFSRISSRFQLRRWHPILHKFRSHRGVDYAAPRGTPVKATGKGKITFVGRKGGLGKAILIKHAGKYTTVYGHLNKYAKGMKRGRNVRQGQIIGYVGSTGLATGPHLHYEFRVNGVHKNPLTVKLPKAEPIHSRYRIDFRRKTRKLISQIDVLSRTRLALQSTNPKGKN